MKLEKEINKLLKELSVKKVEFRDNSKKMIVTSEDSRSLFADWSAYGYDKNETGTLEDREEYYKKYLGISEEWKLIDDGDVIQVNDNKFKGDNKEYHMLFKKD